MAKNTINRGVFFVFGRTLPIGVERTISTHSKYARGADSTVSPAVVTAIKALRDEGACFVGETITGKFAAEAYGKDGTVQAVLYDPATGEVRAAEKIGTRIIPYSLGRSGHSGRLFILGLFPVLMHDKEFREAFGLLPRSKSWGDDCYAASLNKGLGIISSQVYSRLTLMDSGEEGFIPLAIPSTGNCKTVEGEILDGERILNAFTPGRPLFFMEAEHFGEMDEDGKEDSPFEASEEEDKEERIFSRHYKIEDVPEEYKSLVPLMPEYYSEPEEVAEICLHIEATSYDTEPMRNILLRGPAGSGKSMDAQAIAARLGRPFVSLTCSANMELSDLLFQVLPNVKENKLPELSWGDILYDPEGAWEKLTGEVREAVEPEEVFDRLMAEKASASDKDFILMESDFVRAIRNGWGVELQEVASITQPGVLTGLNKILNLAEMRTEGMLMPDGSRLVRHPDAVVIMTTNVGYEGCRTLNQAVVDRMSLIYDVTIPNEKELFTRTRNKTGLKDEEVLRKMVKVVLMIGDYLKNQGITGSCGPRALNDWARSYLITGDVAKACINTVINKAVDDPDDKEALISGCLYAHFRP